jgi:hypothetical protein
MFVSMLQSPFFRFFHCLGRVNLFCLNNVMFNDVIFYRSMSFVCCLLYLCVLFPVLHSRTVSFGLSHQSATLWLDSRSDTSPDWKRNVSSTGRPNASTTPSILSGWNSFYFYYVSSLEIYIVWNISIVYLFSHFIISEKFEFGCFIICDRSKFLQQLSHF